MEWYSVVLFWLPLAWLCVRADTGHAHAFAADDLSAPLTYSLADEQHGSQRAADWRIRSSLDARIHSSHRREARDSPRRPVAQSLHSSNAASPYEGVAAAGSGLNSAVYEAPDGAQNPTQYGLVRPLAAGVTSSDPYYLLRFYYMLSCPTTSMVIQQTAHRDAYEAIVCFAPADFSSLSAASEGEEGDGSGYAAPVKVPVLGVSPNTSQTWRTVEALDFSAVSPTCLPSIAKTFYNFLPALAVSPSRRTVFLFGFGAGGECGQLASWNSEDGLVAVKTSNEELVPHLYHALASQVTDPAAGAYRLVSFAGLLCPNGTVGMGGCQPGSSDLWQLKFSAADVTDGNWAKVSVNATSDVPEPRFSADVYTVSADKLLIYGGFSLEADKALTLCDVWEFETSSLRWSVLGNLSVDCEQRSVGCGNVIRPMKQLTTFLPERLTLLVLVALCGSTDFTVFMLDLRNNYPWWETVSKSTISGDLSFVFFGGLGRSHYKLSLVATSSMLLLVEQYGVSTHSLVFEHNRLTANESASSASLVSLDAVVAGEYVGNWGCVASPPVLLPMRWAEQVFDVRSGHRVTMHAFMLGGMCGEGSSNIQVASNAPMPVWTLAGCGDFNQPLSRAFFTKTVVRPGPPFGERIGLSVLHQSDSSSDVLAMYGGGHSISISHEEYVLAPADVWCFDLQKYHWLKSVTTTTAGQRMFHIAYTVTNTSFVVYGGSDQLGDVLHAVGDIHLFQFTDLSQCKGDWFNLTQSVTPDPLPSLYGHAVTQFKRHTLVYSGGTIDVTCCASELLFALTVDGVNNVSWRIVTFKVPPLGRQFHSISVYNDDSLLVFGNRSKPWSRHDYYSTAMLFVFNESSVLDGEVEVLPFFDHDVIYMLHKVGGYFVGGRTTFEDTMSGDDLDLTLVYGSQCVEMQYGLCPVGYGSYSHTCQLCPRDTISSSVSSSCRDCQNGTYTNRTGSTNFTDCQPPDPCRLDLGPCNGHGECHVNEHGQAVCTCDQGYMPLTMCYLPIVYMIAGTVFLIAVLIIMAVARKYHASRKDSREKHRQLRASNKKITELTQVWEIQWQQLTMREKVASGGFGEVWRAELSDMLVAVKKLHRHSLHDPSSIRDFERESELMRTVRHPNVVLFLGAGTMPNGDLFLVMEFLKRGSLRGQLKDSSVQLDYGDKLRSALDAAKGMAFLHSLTPPRIHRDLKSANLLVSDKWVVKVADFGTSRLIEKLDTLQPVQQELGALTEENRPVQETTPLLTGGGLLSAHVGTHFWQSPEMMQRHVYGCSTDVYSFGIVLWEIFFREAPFQEQEDFRFYTVLMEAVTNGYRPRLPENEEAVPADYCQLMQSCWDGSAEKRPTFQEVVAKLTAMADAIYAGD